MRIGSGYAPGKVILFGEHAVVYRRPALAVPVTQVQAGAIIEENLPGAGLVLWAQDLDEQLVLKKAAEDHPLAVAVRLALGRLGLAEPDWRIVVHSTIPIASGLGSGAAVTTAIIRAVADAAGQPLSPAEVSALAYEVEKLHHGTPSGVDNTVIAYSQPVYFRRGLPPEPFRLAQPFTLVIADSGVRSPTRITVSEVRQRWLRDPRPCETLFDAIAEVVEVARAAMAAGNIAALGPLMDRNHHLLSELGVSSKELDRLAVAARAAGAAGAKLSGGGRGGNLIALVEPEAAASIATALQAAGAAQVIVTTVGESWTYINS